MATEEKNSILANHRLKQKDLFFEVEITANATPADKKHASDLPGIAVLRTEGKTAEADAIESVSFTTAADNSTGDSQFGILMKGSEMGDMEKVLKVEVTEQTSLATSLSVSKVGSDFLTSEGNIAIDIAGTGLALDTESPKLLVRVVYLSDL